MNTKQRSGNDRTKIGDGAAFCSRRYLTEGYQPSVGVPIPKRVPKLVSGVIPPPPNQVEIIHSENRKEHTK